jgi:hypothetical protein
MTDRLNSGESLASNDSLRSADSRFTLTLQSDGNLVLYESESEPVWASGTDGQAVSRASMQPDGNLVLYSSGGEAAWASGTDGHDGAYLLLQDDRNLVIYGPDGSPLWASDTSE